MKDRRLTIQETVEQVEICADSAHEILCNQRDLVVHENETQLKASRFQSREKLRKNATMELNTILKEASQNRFRHWKECWDKLAPYPPTLDPFSCRPAQERSSGWPCEGGCQRSCGSKRLHGPYIDPALLQG
ncbi:hypothetical protein TNCV_3709071 [Trichonephila clavipes]|nr:hypothetical protein TNCV_3709071 [Trichonephila clavipes]